MADNYLEKKMEELRSGKLKNLTKPGHKGKSGIFKAKRVVIIPPKKINENEAHQIFKLAETITGYVGKSAIVISSGSVFSRLVPRGRGIRIVITPENKLKEEISRLYDAWLGLDAVISLNNEVGEKFEQVITEKKKSFPSISIYQARIIEIDKEKITNFQLPIEEIISHISSNEITHDSKETIKIRSIF
ncbi:MAG: hypothetical protein NC097_00645 [Clostridium sp.]|nr:hypothetical protein [Prevotella sp.]MCM1428288.1 hypothetical protein [Clostridium sp.]MCM1476242.1 hypothetical protein [Muribaculaceae bacterium]